MPGMGVLFDYFAANSDESAATAIDRVGGPSSNQLATADTPAAPPQRRGLFRRKAEPTRPPTAPEPPAEPLEPFDTVTGCVDPVVQMGTFEELLTGRPYDDIVEDPRSGHVVADRDGGQRLVVTLNDALTAALVAASDERLAEVAVPWVETEEFWGDGDAQLAAEFLRDVAALARRATADGQRLYCWICV
jgi:hypothetical protein